MVLSEIVGEDALQAIPPPLTAELLAMVFPDIRPPELEK